MHRDGLPYWKKTTPTPTNITHPIRLKLKLTVQKEVMNGAVLQEAVVIEYVVRNQQCPDCQASYTTGAWKAIVQVSPLYV